MSTWTDEKVETLKRLRKEGHSFGEISKRVGVSRSGCIGKANRLGLASHTPSKPVRGKPRHKLECWNAPDARDPDHAVDAMDLAILDELVKGRAPLAIAKDFKTTEDRVRELWRVREAQEPVGEVAA